MILESILKLFRHMEWADALMWSSVLRSQAAIDDSDILERIRHIHTVQHAFLNTWKGNQHVSNAGGSLTLLELLQWARNFHLSAPAYVESLTEESLEKPIAVPWARGVEARMGRPASTTTFGDTAYQAVLHSTQHRGQVSMRLRELGEERVTTDFIVWLWMGQPKPEWPSDAIK